MLLEVVCKDCEQDLTHYIEDGIMYVSPCSRCTEELEEILIEEIRENIHNDYQEPW